MVNSLKAFDLPPQGHDKMTRNTFLVSLVVTSQQFQERWAVAWLLQLVITGMAEFALGDERGG